MNSDSLNKNHNPLRPSMVSSATPIASPYKVGPADRPMMQQVTVEAPVKSESSRLVTIVIITVVSLAALVFAALFLWMMMEKNEAESNTDEKIAAAVVTAKEEQRQADYADFDEREKSPYNTFVGPQDYGGLTFTYPKTWSVYVAVDNSGSGGDFVSYFNPYQVKPVSPNTVNSLRVSILNSNFSTVAQTYQKVINDGKVDLTMQSITIGANENITANLYTGAIPGSDLRGYVVIFKIRDKTAVLQTDSLEQYREDFERILGAVSFKE